MIYFVLFGLGLCLGSFVNALTWRLAQQLDTDGNPKKANSKELLVDSSSKGRKPPNVQRPASSVYSIVNGRSMCPNCKHVLGAKDLVPVLSWLSLGGKCRYCKKPIAKQYPFVELLTATLFVVSYWAWDFAPEWAVAAFVAWLVVLVGLMALAVYDIRHMLLPNRLTYPLIGIALVSLVVQFVLGRPVQDLWGVATAIVVAAGIFWALYQVSDGRWIGGGDVTFGILAGLLLASPVQAFLYMFIASVLGVLYILPLMATKKLTRASKVPFGPFLIASLIITVLWGVKFTTWYSNSLLGY